MKRALLPILLGLSLVSPCLTRALTNNIALTPPMGWDDWNAYACNVSEDVMTNTALTMVANGMKAAGYQYINIDDGWSSGRDPFGILLPYSVSGKFPHGMPWLANFMHSQGLKLGIYLDHGTEMCSTCLPNSGHGPGSLGYEYIDAFTIAQWGVDYLKNDSCNLPRGDNSKADYFRMADGLMKSGRPIYNAICEHAEDYEYWSPDEGNSWRSINDITTAFSRVMFALDQDQKSAYLAGPGRWNDPDMMEIGNGFFGSNLTAAQTHFTMWCIMAAPLIQGENVTKLSSGDVAILTNAEVIAVDQDAAGEQGVVVGGVRDSAEVWSKPLGYDFTTRAVALLNRSTNSSASITCYWTNLAFQPGTTATVRDLVSHTDLGTFTGSFTATVPAYGSRMLKIVGTPIAAPGTGTHYLTSLQPIYSYVNANNAWASVNYNKSFGGNAITLNGVTYTNGLGVSAISGLEYDLGGVCSSFQATIGVDDEVGANGSLIFQVFADGRKIFDSGIMTGSSNSQNINLDVTGVRRLTIGVTDTGNNVSPGPGSRDNNDHADWANARVIVNTTTPQLPETPTGMTAAQGNAIALNWNDTLAAITYNVKRATHSGGPYTTIANTPLSLYSDANVSSGTTYYYVVSAVSSFGESANSSEASAAPCNVPVPPANVSAQPDASEVLVSWNASSGATSYSVYRFTGSTPPQLVGSGITGTSFLDGGAAPATTNYYLVTAGNACNQSAYSDYASAISPASSTPDFTISATPQSQTVTVGNNAAYTVNVGNVNGFTGTITFGNSGLPANAQASFTPPSDTSPGSSTFTVSTSASTPLGAYNLTITGTSGSIQHSTNVTLVVSGGALPSGWTDVDVGGVGMAGSASYSSGTFLVSGSGTDIYNTGDQFNFAYQPVSGDQTIIARVASENGTQGYAKAGIMFRETLNSNAVEASVLITPSNGVAMEVRPTTAAATINMTGWIKGVLPPQWVRLVRSGNTFTGSYSTDGSTWTQLASTNVVMATSADAGLAVTAHSNTSLNTAKIDNVSLTGSGTPDFSMSTSPPSQTVTAGNGTTYTTSVSALNGFAGTVTFSVSGLPTGAGDSFSPSSVTGSGSSTLSITTATTTPAGTYPLTVTGTSGALAHNNSITLVVNAASTNNFAGIYQIQNEASSLVLNNQGSLTNGSPVTQWTIASSSNLDWTFIATSNGYYQINSSRSRLDMVVANAATTNGARIIQWSFGSSRNDQWKPVANGDGSYTFYNLKSGLVLGDPGSSTNTTTQMDQETSTGGNNQHWNLLLQ